MSSRKKVGIFLALTLLLSALSYLPILASGTLRTHGGLFVLTLMWSPGLAAILTQLIATRGLRGMGWRLGSARWLGIAYILPVLYALPVYAVTWLTGLGTFPNPGLIASLAEQYSTSNSATTVTIFVLIGATAGVAMNLVFALGEEIGWRGLLVPELAKITSFTNTALISGTVWAVWHMPGIFLADYNSGGTPALYSAACFFVLVVGVSFPFAWLTLKSGSLWPAALLHASHNQFIQGIFDQLTGKTSVTPYITGEFGVGLALSGIVVAYVFWRMKRAAPRRNQPPRAEPAA